MASSWGCARSSWAYPNQAERTLAGAEIWRTVRLASNSKEPEFAAAQNWLAVWDASLKTPFQTAAGVFGALLTGACGVR